MKALRFVAGLILVCSILLFVSPLWIMRPCDAKVELVSGKTMPMKCYWSALVSSLLGCITGVSAITVVARAQYSWLDFLPILACGLAAALTPTVLIGTCSGTSMDCVVRMKPMVVMLSILIVAASGLSIMRILFLKDKQRKQNER